MPAILAHANELEIEVLKNFARHTGIAFQIKDDLLDVEGNLSLLGKSIGKDAEKAMWEHYCLAMEALQEVTCNTTFLKHLLNYIVNRDH